MRGSDIRTGDLFSYVDLEQRVPANHPVYTENSIHVSESPNVGDDDRAILPLPGPVRLAVQVEKPICHDLQV